MNEKKVQSRKRNQNQTQKKSRDRQAQPRNTFGNQHRSQFQAAFQIFCRRWLPVCIAALILSGTANLLRESRLQQEVAAKIVRFHVRANSDCASDQQIKLQVRDAVAEELQTILHGAETKAETEEILRENEPSIRAAALQTLRAGGSTDDITVTYGKARKKKRAIIFSPPERTTLFRSTSAEPKGITGGACCIRPSAFRMPCAP